MGDLRFAICHGLWEQNVADEVLRDKVVAVSGARKLAGFKRKFLVIQGHYELGVRLQCQSYVTNVYCSIASSRD